MGERELNSCNFLKCIRNEVASLISQKKLPVPRAACKAPNIRPPEHRMAPPLTQMISPPNTIPQRGTPATTTATTTGTGTGTTNPNKVGREYRSTGNVKEVGGKKYVSPHEYFNRKLSTHNRGVNTLHNPFPVIHSALPNYSPLTPITTLNTFNTFNTLNTPNIYSPNNNFNNIKNINITNAQIVSAKHKLSIPNNTKKTTKLEDYILSKEDYKEDVGNANIGMEMNTKRTLNSSEEESVWSEFDNRTNNDNKNNKNTSDITFAHPQVVLQTLPSLPLKRNIKDDNTISYADIERNIVQLGKRLEGDLITRLRTTFKAIVNELE